MGKKTKDEEEEEKERWKHGKKGKMEGKRR